MNVFLFTSKETETRARVTGVHYYPDQLTEEDKTRGIVVEEYREPPIVNEKFGISYINPQTKEITYEYIDAWSDQQQIEALRAENKEMKRAIAELTMMIATPQV